MSAKYNLSDTQIRQVAIIVFRESGNILPGVKACASQMCNYYEAFQKKNFKNVYECVFGSGWYWSKEKNDQWVKDHPTVPQSVVDAVDDVIRNGNRTLPEYVVEYDQLQDYKYIINDGVKYTDKSYILNRNNYHKDRTTVCNRFPDADEYTFYCFPDGTNGHCDAFGYLSKGGNTMPTTNIPDKACTWAEGIAADQSHGYSQQSRWGPNYDCSSLVIEAYIKAGVPIDKTKVYYTGNMDDLKNYGFKDVTAACNLDTGSGMQRGDILYYHISGTNGHTAMYCGNGKIVHARGQSYGSSASGDQGSEIAVTNYSRSKWQYVLRYKGSGSTVSLVETLQNAIVTTTMPEIKNGSIGSAVGVLQGMLNMMGYKGKNAKALDIDGDFGANTAHALQSFQKAAGLTVDGVCGKATWKKLKEGMIVG